MKKILAVLSVLGIAGVLTGCSNMQVSNYQQNIQDFKEHIGMYTDIDKVQTVKTKIDNYVLTSTNLDSDKENKDNVPILKVETEEQTKLVEENGNNANENRQTEKLETSFEQTSENSNTSKETKQVDEFQTPKLETGDVELNPQNTFDDENKQISSLYSLSSDIDNCCENFITLKQNITDAILETQNLINKVNNKEIELTNEQKLLITEQSKQLKDLGRQLARTTTELSISLSDLNNLMLNNGDINSLSLKYMIVLDNLINGNEMLENGLHSLNLINTMFNMGTPLPPNNTGRILYGFRRNNEEPIIKDYLIDNEGNIKENTSTENNEKTEEENKENLPVATAETEQNEKNEKKGIKNIDTMQNNKKMNTDSYRNNYRNVDSFFNTALLDNEFMYGNGYGYGPMANGGLMYGYGNNGNYIQPYANGYENQNLNNNTTESVLNNNNTQQMENNTAKNKKHSKFKLAKNVDSYKDENTPTLSTRFGKIKKAVSGFFDKFHKKSKENPVYRFNPNEDGADNQ